MGTVGLLTLNSVVLFQEMGMVVIFTTIEIGGFE